MSNQTRWLLSAGRLPRHWLNVASIVRNEYPLPHGSDDHDLSLGELEEVYTSECARIELLAGRYATERWIDIPEAVWQLYSLYRPSPLVRATGLERKLSYSGELYYKREDLNPTGSHKPNTAIPQAQYAKQEGLEELITDTGAGQWGAALAWACNGFQLTCTVFMTRSSFETKPYRPLLMALSGANVHASPSNRTARGRELLAQDPQHVGSLGIGMGEAVETVLERPQSRLALGCMSYHAALHQTIVGQELSLQLEDAGVEPDILVGCVGGGTNLFGFASPWLAEKLEGKKEPEIVAAESENVPSLTKGEYRYDFADSFGLTPKVLMYTLGHRFVPPEMHSGGLRYHGKSPMLSLMVRKGLVRPTAISQAATFSACRLFFECEGVLPAPESGHAIAAVLDEVAQARAEGRPKKIVFCLSGTGYLDLQGYSQNLRLW